MEEAIAIMMKKRQLENDCYIFQATNVVIGSIANHDFFDDSEVRMLSMNSYDDVVEEKDSYIGFPVSEKRLNEVYPSFSLKEKLKIYSSFIKENLYFVKVDKEKKSLIVENIPVSNLENKDLTEKLKKLFQENKQSLPSKDTIQKEEKTNFNVEQQVQKAKRIPMNIDLEELENYLKERMVGQDEIIETLAPIITRNFRKTNHRGITYTLSIGQTGTGKTLFFELVRDYLKEKGYPIPVAIIGSNNLSQTGYIGDKITTILKQLYLESKEDLDYAQNGIIVLDEFDKIADRGARVADVAVQETLLKLYDGISYEVEISPRKTIFFDTSLLQIAALGAFAEITNKKEIGFHKESETRKKQEQKVSDYGIDAQLLARIGVTAVYQPMTVESGVDMLKHSLISPMKEITDFMKKNYNIDVRVSDGLYYCIAKEAIARKENARGFKSEVERITSAADREIQLNLSKSNGGTLWLNEDTFYNNKVYQLKLNPKSATMK